MTITIYISFDIEFFFTAVMILLLLCCEHNINKILLAVAFAKDAFDFIISKAIAKFIQDNAWNVYVTPWRHLCSF
jgi:hypothetical protein